MSFVTALALAIGLLVAVPYFAHRLRRRRAEERPFAPARLVPAALPKARRRSQLEDRALFGTRALSILALAVLGASPLVRCSRLALQRSGGASVALAVVLDVSMSMRVKQDQASSRFDRARDGAKELLASAREGDAVAIVLAGAPARVALAATTDLGAARAALDALSETDRATDLDGAISMARALVSQLPQSDKRVVVLSDLADGHPEAPPVGVGSAMQVWVSLPELRGPPDAPPKTDCAIVAAEREGPRVHVRVACSPGGSASGRQITLHAAGKELAHAAAPTGSTGESALTLPSEDTLDVTARLEGVDAIPSDDVAPVVVSAGPGAVAIAADPEGEAAATGGAPIVEQALAALRLEIAVRPVPAIPDRAEDLGPFAGVILDDPPGLTPEQRRALGTFLENGGVALLALGPRAAAAPLGASFEPLLAHATTWSPTPVPGAEPGSATTELAEAAASLSEAGAKDRTTLAPEDVKVFDPLLVWTDGAPFVARRAVGRGEAWIVTLPFSVDASDLTLRPAFLALLDAWVSEARLRASPRRTDVGVPWTFANARAVEIEGPAGPVPVTREAALVRATPSVIGAYRITVDGRKELRVAAPHAREVDLRPRAAAPGAGASALGDNHAATDVSWVVALVLLALLAAELGLRFVVRGGSYAQA